MPLRALLAAPERRRRLLLLTLAAVVGWLAFFDSHSLFRRWSYHRELKALEAENAALEAQNADLVHRLDAGLSDALVERVAREQYGMRRPGETVYRVAEEEK
jgi:cell division protein FtsB